MLWYLLPLQGTRKGTSMFDVSTIRAWVVIDWAMAVYSTYLALILLWTRSIPQWPVLVLLHFVFIVFLWLLPPRGASWEDCHEKTTWRTVLRKTVVFLRYMYPLIPALLFFEEGRLIVNAIFPETPYWFEPYLYAADHWIFGDHPSIVLLPFLSWPLNELMHFFYFSYFVLIVVGPLLGRLPSPGSSDRDVKLDRPEFDAALTCMILGFFCAFVLYPWLAARGPFENVELISSLSPLEGGPFTFLARWITDGAAVSGNCFPSGHVAGTWGYTFGILAYRRPAGWVLVPLAIGISVSCVYTRYHHAVDVPAGFLMGVLGTTIYFAAKRRLDH